MKYKVFNNINEFIGIEELTEQEARLRASVDEMYLELYEEN